jgi:hypothetical protein
MIVHQDMVGCETGMILLANSGFTFLPSKADIYNGT